MQSHTNHSAHESSSERIPLLEAFGKIFLSSLFIYCLGTLLFDVQFAKLGIPITIFKIDTSSAISEMKLFLSEIVVLIGFVPLLFYPKYVMNRISSGGIAIGFTLFLLFFGATRALFGFAGEPILTIRNAAFVWYLLIPLMIFLYGISAYSIEYFCKILTFVIVGYLIFTLCFSMFGTRRPGADWIIFAGIMSVLWLAATTRSKILSAAILILIGLSFGFDFSTKLQRTTLLGLAFFFLLCFVFRLVKPIRLTKMVGVITAFAVVGFLAIQNNQFLEPASQKNPKDSSEKAFDIKAQVEKSWFKGTSSDGQPVEQFRRYMLKDGFNLFLYHPFWGIGFQGQVVYRVYWGFIAGNSPGCDQTQRVLMAKNAFECGHYFIANTGYVPDHPGPPISGPHNSYLNALARMGMAGLGFLLLHLFSIYRLFRQKLMFTAWLLMGGVIYAFFNVGLEGPARSFILLLAVGASFMASSASSERLENRQSESGKLPFIEKCWNHIVITFLRKFFLSMQLERPARF